MFHNVRVGWCKSKNPCAEMQQKKRKDTQAPVVLTRNGKACNYLQKETNKQQIENRQLFAKDYFVIHLMQTGLPTTMRLPVSVSAPVSFDTLKTTISSLF